MHLTYIALRNIEDKTLSHKLDQKDNYKLNNYRKGIKKNLKFRTAYLPLKHGTE